MSGAEDVSTQEGSWTPTILFVIIGTILWLSFGKGGTPIKFRRWYNIKRVYWRKKLGYRDETKYKMGAGDGANQRNFRQG
mmetsp:Transcript_9109/g.13205  ORF Transcript_9109/g.13205 Transcript_9109/m.13205 type:complete len:80 (-) Transcript_9109:116-355(-)